MPLDWSLIEKSTLDEVKKVYDSYGRFGNDAFKGDNMTLKNTDKWLTDAGVLYDKVSTTDTAISFKTVMGNEKAMTFDKFKEFVGELVESGKPADANELLRTVISKLCSQHTPITNEITEAVKLDVVDRLTDPSMYTGTQRFSADGQAVKSGLADLDVLVNDGYVAEYNNANTYDKDHIVPVRLN